MYCILRFPKFNQKKSDLNMPKPRYLNVLGFLLCAAMMGFALFAEHVLNLMPCPLCILQRIAVISLGIVFLVSAIHDPEGYGRKIYAALLTVAATAGAMVAGRHFWLQVMPEDQVPACGPGYDYIIESFPFSEALSMIFAGSGECADVAWSFLGLSMPAWVLISLVTIGVAGIWNNMRSTGAAAIA
jgi:disulfide bond formation protein DsbB